MSAVESRTHFVGAYVGKRVLVTGHTGFKGSWLCEWLLQLGAEVTGLALSPATNPALFDQLELGRRMKSIIGDVRDLDLVRRTILEAKPDFLFHLAAQPLVRLSYEQPVETYATNVMGTVHVLEALRALPAIATDKPAGINGCVAVMVTTDKCYENKEWVHSYREDDAMGGHDPYSSSKAAAELVIAAYRRSFFDSAARRNGKLMPIKLASARAGNVVGGGDWALDRIVPDCIRALRRHESIPVRNKIATRPWQHVLEPVSGYLWLGACMSDPSLTPGGATLAGAQLSNFASQLASAFNFGPPLQSNRTVAQLVQEVLKHWPGKWADRSDPDAVHEAKLLNLATDKAHHFLGWKSVWEFSDMVRETVDWYKAVEADPKNAPDTTRNQIGEYVAAARKNGLPWAL